jgi:hypothetical protein
MPLITVPKTLGDGGSGFNRQLGQAIRQLQLRKHNAVAGAAAATNIALAGVTTGSTILSVVNLTDGVDVALNTVTISAAGQIRVSTDTTGKKLLVDWAPATA